MLAARNFSAARQCLRSVRVTPSFVAPIYQVHPAPPISKFNLPFLPKELPI
jgi:isocitrate dehydrogenase (NAD+)